MYKYKYALIDANYILRRNTEAICKDSSELIAASKIVDSFHTSIRKLMNTKKKTAICMQFTALLLKDFAVCKLNNSETNTVSKKKFLTEDMFQTHSTAT